MCCVSAGQRLALSEAWLADFCAGHSRERFGAATLARLGSAAGDEERCPDAGCGVASAACAPGEQVEFFELASSTLSGRINKLPAIPPEVESRNASVLFPASGKMDGEFVIFTRGLTITRYLLARIRDRRRTEPFVRNFSRSGTVNT